MEMRELGTSGLKTPRLVLGGNVFGWTVDGAEAFAILDRFIDAGGTMIDTADVYSSWVPGHIGGESESLVGAWLKARGRRDDVLIATKVGYDEGLSAAAIERGVDASLRRLGTDHIDLYYTHRDDPNASLEEALGALDRLVRAGKVRALGASQIGVERLSEALRISKSNGLAAYSVLQTWYNLLERARFEGVLAETARQEGLGVLPYYGLASGYLTGKYRTTADLREGIRSDRAASYMQGQGPAVLAALDDVAAETGATVAQVALAWTAAKPGITAPIASATSLRQVEELIGAMTLDLSGSQIAHLDAVSAAADRA